MAGHLRVRCSHFQFLVLSENVHSINVWTEPINSLPARIRLARNPDRARVLDGRVLLGVSKPDRAPPRVALDWRSSDGTRSATLIVDEVDRLVDCDPRMLLNLPRVPKQIHGLFDRVMFDQGIFLLRLNPDAELNMSGFAGRRRFRSAAIVTGHQTTPPLYSTAQDIP